MNCDIPETEARDERTRHLDILSTPQLVGLLVAAHRRSVDAVAEQSGEIAAVVENIAARLRAGGRLHYVGAGTSGRLAVLDAAEMMPTFGTAPEMVCAHIAGGGEALRGAVEGAEDERGAVMGFNDAANNLALIVGPPLGGYAIDLNLGGQAPCYAVALAAHHDDVRVAVGVHPHRAASWGPEALDQLTKLARDPRVVAIGEVGMDFSGRSAPPELQEAAFRGQLALATLLDLPAVIHVRDAGDRVRAILAEQAEVRGMIHCYSEGPDELLLWLELGLHISFAGTLTYPGSDRLRTASALVPAHRLLAETDAPYLAPQNARGQRNEPLYVAATHAALARERGADIGDLAKQIGQNARALFGERWGT